MSASCLLLAAVGCGDSGGGASDAGFAVGRGDGGVRGCVDEDHDGYGFNCSALTRDCDDGDPSVTNECFRCRSPGPGCPCDPGTKPMDCKPDPIPVKGGVLVCRQGTTYCRDGKWSKCEVIGEYTFVATGDQ